MKRGCCHEINDKLTEDVTDFGPLRLLLQDESESGADVNVADVVQQDAHDAPGQMRNAAEAHELTELERGRTSKSFSLYVRITEKIYIYILERVKHKL